ncbi:MAG: recombinase family protein, partial [Waterburya sp.]
KDEGVSGKVEQRPAIKELLAFLAQNKGCVVVIDEIKRVARDAVVHMTIKAAIQKLGCKIEYLNNNFDDSAESSFIELILAGAAQLEREQNARQVKQKMMARMKEGYYCFSVKGYDYIKKEGGKLLVPNEEAEILKKVYQDIASGTLRTITEIVHYTQSMGIRGGKDTIKQVLLNPVYAGFIDYPSWGINWVKAKHEPIIDLNTFNIAKEKLGNYTRTSNYKIDDASTFFYHSLISCKKCGKNLTHSLARSATGKNHFYYFCFTKHCELRSKTYSQNFITNTIKLALADIEISNILRVIIDKACQIGIDKYKDNMLARIKKLKLQKTSLESDIKSLVDKITKAKSDKLITIYENSLLEKKNELSLIESSISNYKVVDTTPLMKQIRKVLDIISNPAKHFEEADNDGKRGLIKLFFKLPLSLDKNQAFQTLTLSHLIEEISRLKNENSAMVDGSIPISNSFELFRLLTESTEALGL